jgi:3-dehydroquinate dehydratase type I
LSAAEQRFRLLEAVRVGPTLLDVDAQAPPEVRDEVLAVAREAGVGVVLSRHWPNESPGLGVLCDTVARLLEEKTEVVKVAARCDEASVLAELLRLYSAFPEARKRLVVLGMGRLGALARLTILQLGAPFTFVAPDRGKATAPGQLRLSVARRMLDEAGVI